MAGAICGTCHYSSTGNIEPHCGRSDCPNKNATFLPSQVKNLKQMFAEHDIPWPATAPWERPRLIEADDMFKRVAQTIRKGTGYSEVFCLDMTRAVLVEMHEPTAAMLRAATGESPKAIWQAMLNEALK